MYKTQISSKIHVHISITLHVKQWPEVFQIIQEKAGFLFHTEVSKVAPKSKRHRIYLLDIGDVRKAR